MKKSIVLAVLICCVVSQLSRGEDAPADQTIVLQAQVNLLKATLKQRDQRISHLEATIKDLQAQLKDAQAPVEAKVKELEANIKTLEVNIKALEGNIKTLEAENLRIQKQPPPVMAKGLNVVPFTGDEIPLSRLKTKPSDYIDVPFIVVGRIETKNYYNAGYGRAQETHVSFGLIELRANGTSTGDVLSVYGKKAMCGSLVDAIVAADQAGQTKRVVRLKVTFLRNRFSADFMMAELIDWQYLGADGTTWGPWQIGK